MSDPAKTKRVQFKSHAKFDTVEGESHSAEPGDIIELPARSADYWIAQKKAEEVPSAT